MAGGTVVELGTEVVEVGLKELELELLPSTVVSEVLFVMGR